MDVEESWGCRIQLEMHQSSSAAVAGPMNGSKFYLGDDEAWECFPCPFCYMDVEVPALCSHLQEEHCFDIKNAVCPVCAANPGKDMIGHFTVQHSQLLKSMKSPKTSLSSAYLETSEKEPYYLNSYLEETSAYRRENSCDSVSDPLLSSFMQSVSFSDSKGDQEANGDHLAGVMPTLNAERLEPSVTTQDLKLEDFEEKSERVEFIQQLLFSTIF